MDIVLFMGIFIILLVAVKSSSVPSNLQEEDSGDSENSTSPPKNLKEVVMSEIKKSEVVAFLKKKG
ncbi:MAG: hypothetical protein P8Y06_00770 [Patescibacteria group bacterium]